MKSFTSPRQAALALLNDPTQRLSRRAGSFLGQCVVDDAPLSPKQLEWLENLLERAGQPSLSDGGNYAD